MTPSAVPAVREIAWISAVPQLLVLAVLVFASYRFLTPGRLAMSLAVGAAAYLAYSQICRRVVTRGIRRGLRCLQQEAYRKAIAEFEEAYAFFSRHPWIDRFRYLTVLSSSAYGYREMALCNIAFAYAQMGERERAAESYRRALDEFPGCAVARAALEAAGEEPAGAGGSVG